MKKKKFTPPTCEVFELKSSSCLLIGTGKGGGGNLPPTENDNSDNDW